MSAEQRRRALFILGLLGVLAISAAFRLPGLADKPLHSDEGVNGWFTLRLYWWNVYRYQHTDYHGPFLYYVNLLFFWLMKPSDAALRMGTVIAGISVPLMLLPVRRWMGGVGIAVAGLLTAVAPCMVYFSRTNIHELYLIAFSALWAASLARFAHKPAMKWGLLASLAAALCFANKETTVLTVGFFGLSAGAAWLLGTERQDGEDDLFGGRNRTEALRDWLWGARWIWLAGIVLFAVVTVLLFSSFFSYGFGVKGFFLAYTPWLEHGTTGRNQGKPFLYFWEVMRSSQGFASYAILPAVLFALVRRHRVGVFLTTWAASAFLVYSLIPYKTPWCVVNIDLPVFLLCGWGAQQAWLLIRDADRPTVVRVLATVGIVLPLLAVPGLARESLQVNAEGYDDGSNKYVYVQTKRGFYAMISDHVGVAAGKPDSDGLGVQTVNVDAKNPARWYLITRGWDHERIRYIKTVPKKKHIERADIVVATGKHTRKVKRLVEEAGDWHKEDYDLRPGWKVTAWYRQGLWDAYEEAGGREAFAWPLPEVESPHRPTKPKRYRRNKADR